MSRADRICERLFARPPFYCPAKPRRSRAFFQTRLALRSVHEVSLTQAVPVINCIFDKKVSETLNMGTEKTMVETRGFQRLKEFNQQLLHLYQNRKSGQTVADLYPAILEWAAK